LFVLWSPTPRALHSFPTRRSSDLVALLEALQKNPRLRAVHLIARWHGTEQGRLLRALAEKEWLIAPDNLEQQFFDTITRLVTRQRERRLEHLLQKARLTDLSADEKDQLRRLLSRDHEAETGRAWRR